MSSFLVMWVPAGGKAIVRPYYYVTQRPVVIGTNQLRTVGLPVFIVAIEGKLHNLYVKNIYIILCYFIYMLFYVLQVSKSYLYIALYCNVSY